MLHLGQSAHLLLLVGFEFAIFFVFSILFEHAASGYSGEYFGESLWLFWIVAVIVHIHLPKARVCVHLNISNKSIKNFKNITLEYNQNR